MCAFAWTAASSTTTAPIATSLESAVTASVGLQVSITAGAARTELPGALTAAVCVGLKPASRSFCSRLKSA